MIIWPDNIIGRCQFSEENLNTFLETVKDTWKKTWQEASGFLGREIPEKIPAFFEARCFFPEVVWLSFVA